MGRLDHNLHEIIKTKVQRDGGEEGHVRKSVYMTVYAITTFQSVSSAYFFYFTVQLGVW